MKTISVKKLIIAGVLSTALLGTGIIPSAVPTENYTYAASSKIEKTISLGLKYKGTPYEWGSNRSNDKTFDCSDFVKWIFKRGAGVTLPSNSAAQGTYVKKNTNEKSNWKKLKRGDLMFFMSYKGSKKSNYSKLNKSKQKVTHVAIYLGNGKMLHTYSKASGGVRVDKVAGTWEYRFLYGGSAL